LRRLSIYSSEKWIALTIIFYLTADEICFEQFGNMKLQKGGLDALAIVLFCMPDVGAEQAKREEFVYPFRLTEHGRCG